MPPPIAPILGCILSLAFSDETRFRSEGLPALHNLEAKAANVRASAVDGLESAVHEMNSPQSPLPVGAALRIFCSMGSEYSLFERRRNLKDEVAMITKEQRRVSGMNAKYAFIAHMPLDKQEYRAIRVVRPPYEDDVFNLRMEFANGCAASWMLVDRSIPAWLETKGCRLQEVRIDASGEVKATIEYESGQHTTKETQAPDFIAQVVFKPSLEWAIQRVDMEVSIKVDGKVVNRRLVKYRIRYAGQVKQVPVPERLIFVSLDSAGNEKTDYVTKFLDYTIGEAQPTDFTLSAFGLPEPPGVTWPKPTPYWLYGTIGSVAVIVLGILLMRWSQRRSAAA